MFNSLWPHGLQHTLLPCPSPCPGVCSNSQLSSWRCRLTISSSSPPSLRSSVFRSIRVFYNKLMLRIKWPKYWSFSISLSNECSGLMSFKIDWFVLLAVQGTLKSLLQHHSLKASVLQHSAFFMVRLSHCAWLLEKPCFDYMDLWQQSDVSAF